MLHRIRKESFPHYTTVCKQPHRNDKGYMLTIKFIGVPFLKVFIIGIKLYFKKKIKIDSRDPP